MLTAEENERFTRIGPDTPMGGLLRQYWHPIAASGHLDENPVKAVQLLGEPLTLFKDKKGRLGLIADRCAHRHVKLVYGIPEEDGLRCCYHGWLYDRTGQCIEQPAEPPESRFKDKIRVKAYPVQEAAGIVWAYLGPEPAPLLPMWDRLVWQDNVVKCVGMTTVPCNWLQMVENYPDFCHAEWLHGWYSRYIFEREGIPRDDPRWSVVLPRIEWRQRKLGWTRSDHGITCRILLDGRTEDDDVWAKGQPVIFPNMTSISGGGGTTLEFAVPLDDTHTLLVDLYVYSFSDATGVPRQEEVPYFEYPWNITDDEGRFLFDMFNTQDSMVFTGQGEIADRTQERLGESDRGIILYRQLLREQMAILEDGGVPMNVFRDPEKNVSIELPVLKTWYGRGRSADGGYNKRAVTAASPMRYSPIAEQVEDLFLKEAEAKEKAGT